MRRYETVFIANPTLSQEERQPLLHKLASIILEPQALLVKFDEWGQRRLAYEIKKQTRGYYVLIDFCGDGSLVKELERNLRLDDRVLKYMTVCTAKEVDEGSVKAEIEAAKEEELQSDLVRDDSEPEAEKVSPLSETSEPVARETESPESPSVSSEEKSTNDSV